MTTTERYIKMRNSQKLDNTWLWEYYKEQGGKLTNMNEFLENFYIVQSPIEVHGHIVGYQRGNRDLSNFFEDMDNKFELTNLFDKEGNFIKVVE
jgi:hypothetical protein